MEATGELAPKNLTETGRREIRHLLRSHDLEMCAVHCPLRFGLDVPDNLQQRLDHIRDTMALAFDLGPRLVIIQAGKVPPLPHSENARGGDGEIGRKGVVEPTGLPISPSPLLPSSSGEGSKSGHMQESLADLGKHGDRTGTILALDTGLDSPETLVAFLDRFDTGSLAVNFNPANLVIAGCNAYDAVKTFRRRIAHVHAQDARRVSPNRMATVPLGHGDIDWMALLAHFEEIDYHGTLTVVGDGQRELTAAVAFLRRFVG